MCKWSLGTTDVQCLQIVHKNGGKIWRKTCWPSIKIGFADYTQLGTGIAIHGKSHVKHRSVSPHAWGGLFKNRPRGPLTFLAHQPENLISRPVWMRVMLQLTIGRLVCQGWFIWANSCFCKVFVSTNWIMSASIHFSSGFCKVSTLLNCVSINL